MEFYCIKFSYQWNTKIVRTQIIKKKSKRKYAQIVHIYEPFIELLSSKYFCIIYIGIQICDWICLRDKVFMEYF